MIWIIQEVTIMGLLIVIMIAEKMIIREVPTILWAYFTIMLCVLIVTVMIVK